MSYMLQQKRFSASTMIKAQDKENTASMMGGKNIKSIDLSLSAKVSGAKKASGMKNIKNSSSYIEELLKDQKGCQEANGQLSQSQKRNEQPLGEKRENTDFSSVIMKSNVSKELPNEGSHYSSNMCYLNSLYNKTKEYSANKEQIRLLEEEKELKECYFSPKINRRPSNENIRTLDDFLSDQSKYDSMKKIKQRQLKEQVAEEEVKELTLMPKINSNMNLIGRDPSVPIHERLFSLKKEQSNSKQALTTVQSTVSQGMVSSFNAGQQENYFSPQINAKSKSLKRKEPVSLILYHDAQRRITQQQQQSRSSMGSSFEGSSFVATSEKSEQVYAFNFVKLFQAAWNNATTGSGSKQNATETLNASNSNKIDYLRMNRMLENLLFVSQSCQLMSASNQVANPNLAKERSLVYDLWGNLKGDAFKGVSKRNLCLFLLVLQGIKNTAPSLESLCSTESQSDSSFSSEKNIHKSQNFSGNIPSSSGNSKTFGYFEGENWFAGEDMSGIHTKYDLLAKNRLNQQRIRNLSPRVIREKEQQEIQKIAQTRQSLQYSSTCSKIISIDLKKRVNSPNDHVALLVQQKTMQLKNHSAQKQAERESELDGCTFQPNLDRCAERIKSPTVGKQKSLALYKMMFKPSSQRRDKSTYDVEYEKQCDECTFNPDLGLTKDSKFLSQQRTQDSHSFVNRDVGKSIERIRSARQNSQNTSLMFTRGYHNLPNFKQPNNNSSMSSSSKKNSQTLQLFRTFDEHSAIDNSKQFMMKSLASDAPTAIEPVNNTTTENRFGGMEWNQSQEWNATNAEGNFMKTTDSIAHPNGRLSQEENIKQSVNSNEERIPLLFVDVNIGKDKQERITIYRGDNAEDLSREFAGYHNLDEKMRQKLEDMLLTQMKEHNLRNADAQEESKN